MSNIIPFPGQSDPFDEDVYVGPVPQIDPHATLHTLTEVAYLLDLSREVTEEYLTDGTIPGALISGHGHWLVSRERLEAWLDALPTEGGF